MPRHRRTQLNDAILNATLAVDDNLPQLHRPHHRRWCRRDPGAGNVYIALTDRPAGSPERLRWPIYERNAIVQLISSHRQRPDLLGSCRDTTATTPGPGTSRTTASDTDPSLISVSQGGTDPVSGSAIAGGQITIDLRQHPQRAETAARWWISSCPPRYVPNAGNTAMTRMDPEQGNRWSLATTVLGSLTQVFPNAQVIAGHAGGWESGPGPPDRLGQHSGIVHSAHQGRLYVAVMWIATTPIRYGVAAPGPTRPTTLDIFLSYSDNGGTDLGLGRAGQRRRRGDRRLLRRSDPFGLRGSRSSTAGSPAAPSFSPRWPWTRTTGTLAVSYEDARYDALRTTVLLANSVQLSIDGGGEFFDQTTYFDTADPGLRRTEPVAQGPRADQHQPGHRCQHRSTDGVRGYRQPIKAWRSYGGKLYGSVRERTCPGRQQRQRGPSLNGLIWTSITGF